MSEPFTLTVSADARYRVVGPEVAAKYAELGGGSAADAAAFGEAIREALRNVFNGTGPGAEAVLKFRTTPEGIEVRVSCGTETTTLRHPLPARKS